MLFRGPSALSRLFVCSRLRSLLAQRRRASLRSERGIHGLLPINFARGTRLARILCGPKIPRKTSALAAHFVHRSAGHADRHLRGVLYIRHRDGERSSSCTVNQNPFSSVVEPGCSYAHHPGTTKLNSVRQRHAEATARHFGAMAPRASTISASPSRANNSVRCI